MNAALISINFETGDVRWSIVTGENSDNPIADAFALQCGIEDDWPGYEFFVIGDEKARELRAKILVGEILGVGKEDGGE